jgi:hypothetical protein
MRHLKWPVLFLLALLYPVSSHAIPRLEVSLRSEPGDFLGLGQTYAFDESDVISPLAFMAADRTGDGQADYLDFSLSGEIAACSDPLKLCFMFLTFGTDQFGASLMPGFYDDAQRAPFADPGHPGLDIGLNGRGCNTSRGSFTITDVVFDEGLQVLRFDASFEQHCEGGEPALFGRIVFDTTAIPAPGTLALLTAGGVLLIARRRRR